MQSFLNNPLKPVFVGHWSNLPIEGPILEDTSSNEDLVLRLLVYENADLENLESYAVDKNFEAILKKQEFKTNTGFSGQQFEVTTTDHPSGLRAVFTAFKNKSTVLVFRSNIDAKKFHNQILSTFRFLTTETTAPK